MALDQLDSADVELIQRGLAALKLYGKPYFIDGELGPGTRNAYEAFRRRSAPGTTEPLWLSIARRELGQKEISGAQDNPRIVEYHKTTTLKATDDETPWCSAFVNWVMTLAGFKGTSSAAARSWLNWGKPLSAPTPGSITVFRRGNSGWEGHVAFFLARVGGTVEVLGGNQGNAVSIARFPAETVLGYRWPDPSASIS